MLNVSKVLLLLFGVSAIIIGVMIFLLGPHLTASIFGTAFRSIAGVDGYLGGLEHPNTDNEMRFYSVFWIAYGGGIIWLSSRQESHSQWVLAALGLFFMGGVGRILSVIATGSPDPLFVALTAIEIIGPVAVVSCLLIGLSRWGG